MHSYRENHTKVAAFVAGWRRKAYPFQQAEVVACPACGGRLHLTQSNKYSMANWVAVSCETPFCVTYTE